MLLAVDEKHLYQLKVYLSVIVKLFKGEWSHCNSFADGIGSTLVGICNTKDKL